MRDEDYPALYRSADAGSMNGQRRFLRATRVRLWGLVLAAVGGGFSLAVGRVDAFGLLGLVAFIAALGAELYMLTEKPDHQWYSGRAAAESAKTLTWRYMVGGQPFPVDGPADAADDAFLARLSEILHDLSELDLAPLLTTDQQITPAMKALRSRSLDERKQAYRQDRIDDQRAWYAAKAQWNARQSSRWSLAALTLECTGIVFAAAKAFGALQVDLLGLLAAAAAGLTAWSQAKQYQTLGRAYAVASQELATIRTHLDRPTAEAEWARLVQEWEEAISREHTLWRASRSAAPSARG